MKKIVIIGAGAMGSAFTVPCVDNDNDVTLIGTHLENELITSIKKNKNFHPALKTNLPSKLKIERFETIGPKIGSELASDAINAIIVGRYSANRRKCVLTARPETLTFLLCG